MYENLLPRFLRYVKTETRSNPESNTTPSTESQIAFANVLKQELEELGLADVHYNATNGYVSATLPSNIEKQVPSIGFIAHMDT
ncbi:MAG: peptidase T, partial [Tetragenococcus koreensis]